MKGKWNIKYCKTSMRRRFVILQEIPDVLEIFLVRSVLRYFLERSSSIRRLKILTYADLEIGFLPTKQLSASLYSQAIPRSPDYIYHNKMVSHLFSMENYFVSNFVLWI